MRNAVLVITTEGQIKFVWDDDLAELTGAGTVAVQRVSDVEPTAGGQWLADLSRIGGPIVGPYALRGAALEQERNIITGQLIMGLM